MNLDPEGWELPLTEHQKQFWSGQKIEPGRPLYELSVVFHLPIVDPARLCAAFDRLVDEEALLRAAIREDAPAPRIVPGERARIEVLDLRKEKAGFLESWLASRLREGLDSSRRLAEAALLLEGEGSGRLFLRLQHLIADGWSVKVLIERLIALYERHPGGDRPGLAPPDRRRIEEEGAYLRSAQFRKDRAFWAARLSQAIRATDFYGSSSSLARGGVIRVEHSLGPRRTALLRTLAARLPAGPVNASLANLLLAALLVLLTRITGSSLQSVGTPFLNRPSYHDRLSFGLFMQLAVVRMELVPGESFLSLAHRVALEASEAGRHVRYTLSNPLRRNFDLLFNFHNVAYPRLEGAAIEEEWIHSANDEMSLTLHVRTVDPGNLLLQFDFNRALFAQEWRRSQLVDHFLRALDGLLLRPDEPVEDLELLGEAERATILAACRGRRRPLPDGRLDELFAAEASRRPEAPAIVEGESVLTFRELDLLSSRLATRLHKLTAGWAAESPVVGCLLPRSKDAVVALLAALKAGGAWLPLDPRLPAARIAAILAEAQPALVLSSGAFLAERPETRELLRGSTCLVELEGGSDAVTAEGSGRGDGAFKPGRARGAVRAVGEDRASGGSLRGEGGAPAGSSGSQKPAYLLFTSGSTGRPKGVVGTHRAAVNRIQWMWSRHPFEPGEVGAHKSSLGFIDSIWEIFGPLLAGHAVLVVPEETSTDPQELSALLARHPVRRLILVPSLLHLLLESGSLGRLTGVHSWFVTGEPLAGALARRFAEALPEATLFNLYGTTEFYDAACLPVGADERAGERVPIGEPIDNMCLYVLDERLRPLPYGVAGELCVSGVAVPAGYRNRLEASGPKFLANPFPEDGNPILCRTGDAARLLPGGCIELLGRLDNQVKLRGYRIEPEEIEHTLAGHDAVARAGVVLARKDGGEPILEAHVERRPASDATEGELLSFLTERLPPWMLPRVRFVDHLPLTPSGKIDRRTLAESPPPSLPARESRKGARTPVEAGLLAIWQRLLGAEEIGIDDDFFDLGGHSLLALTAAAEIEGTFGRRLPLSAIFEHRTIAALASGPLRSLAGQGRQLVALRPASGSPGAPPPLFTVPAAGSTVWSFTALARHLSPEQPLYAFEPRGIEVREAPHRTIEEMARHYVAELRTVQPHGPYSVAGRCFGGYVAFEMARQLRAAGEEISLLAIMDSKEAPLERERQRSHSGARKLLFYYPQRILYYLRRRRLLYTLQMKTMIEARYHLDRLARLFDRGRSPLRSRSRNLKLLKYLHTRAYHRYVAQPFDGKVTLFWAGKSLEMTDEIERWRRLALGGLDCRFIPCRHFELLKEPYIQQLARGLSENLNSLRSTSKPEDRSLRATPASRT